MATRKESIAVSVPGVSVTRMTIDQLYTGMKEKYAIARVESGRSRWWSGGAVWESEPGSLQLQQPGDVHRDLERDGPSVVQIISLAPSIVERITGKIRVQPQLAAQDARGAAFQRLHAVVDRGAGPRELEPAVTEAIAALGAVGDARLLLSRPVRRALELLEAQLAEPLTLAQLAAHAGHDKYHLARAFRAQVGMPPHAYLTRLRIMRAKELLAAGARASEVAARVGLYDQSQLNRHFRRLVGMTPGRYAALTPSLTERREERP